MTKIQAGVPPVQPWGPQTAPTAAAPTPLGGNGFPGDSTFDAAEAPKKAVPVETAGHAASNSREQAISSVTGYAPGSRIYNLLEKQMGDATPEDILANKDKWHAAANAELHQAPEGKVGFIDNIIGIVDPEKRTAAFREANDKDIAGAADVAVDDRKSMNPEQLKAQGPEFNAKMESYNRVVGGTWNVSNLGGEEVKGEVQRFGAEMKTWLEQNKNLPPDELKAQYEEKVTQFHCELMTLNWIAKQKGNFKKFLAAMGGDG